LEIHSQLQHEQGKLNNLRHTVNNSPCQKCNLLKKHQGIEERIQREQRKLKTINRMLAEEQDTYWRQFMNIYTLLKSTGYLDEEDRPTSRGELTAEIRSENEYAMAELVMAEGLLTNLKPAQLAALLSSLVNDSTRENLYVRLPISGQVNHAIREVDTLFRRIDHIQRKHHVQVPIILNPVAAGLVEAWAQGFTWDRLIGATNIGEGDIVRQLRRTADILRQLSRIPGVPEGLRHTAKEALRLIYREPIKETELPEEADILEQEVEAIEVELQAEAVAELHKSPEKER
jgi:superfamily II RNA helicase